VLNTLVFIARKYQNKIVLTNVQTTRQNIIWQMLQKLAADGCKLCRRVPIQIVF